MQKGIKGKGERGCKGGRKGKIGEGYKKWKKETREGGEEFKEKNETGKGIKETRRWAEKSGKKMGMGFKKEQSRKARVERRENGVCR